MTLQELLEDVKRRLTFTPTAQQESDLEFFVPGLIDDAERETNNVFHREDREPVDYFPPAGVRQWLAERFNDAHVQKENESAGLKSFKAGDLSWTYTDEEAQRSRTDKLLDKYKRVGFG